MRLQCKAEQNRASLDGVYERQTDLLFICLDSSMKLESMSERNSSRPDITQPIGRDYG